MEHREFKNLIYNQFSRISKALSSPKRFELLDLLTQGPKTVENLSKETSMSVANTSKHLQALLDARLVTFHKNKNFVYYAIADSSIEDALHFIKHITEARFTDLTNVKKEHIERTTQLKTVHLEDMNTIINNNEALLIDVRPEDEFQYEHISGAISIPINHLKNCLHLLPKNKKIIAYCRGAYCIYATQAVELLNAIGYDAYRLEEGVYEWKQSQQIH